MSKQRIANFFTTQVDWNVSFTYSDNEDKYPRSSDWPTCMSRVDSESCAKVF